MDILLSPSDVEASPGLIIPTKMNIEQPQMPPPDTYIYYDEEEDKIIRDMTFDELTHDLDGKVGIGWRWIVIVLAFGILILFLIPILVGSLLQSLKAERLILGARDYTIYNIPQGETTTVRPDSASSYILGVDYGDNQSNNNIQSTLFINGAIGTLPFGLSTNSTHTFTVSATIGNTGTFTTLLFVRSVTSSDGIPVKFRLLGASGDVSEFSIINAITTLNNNTISFTTSRIFIRHSFSDIFEEIDATDGLV